MAASSLRFINGWDRLVWPKTKSQLVEARAAIDAGEAVGLYIGEHSDGAYVPKSLDDIKVFADIKSIRFGQVRELSSRGIERFQCLEALWIEEFEPFDIGVLPKLQKLSFTAAKGFDVGFRAPKLRTMAVSKSSVQSCQFVSHYPNLEELILLQAGKLESLLGLELARHLNKAVIGYSPRLTDLSALEKCNSLRSLELCTLKRTADYEPVFRLPLLQQLIFAKCHPIASLSHIAGLKALEHLALIDTDVTDGDLAPPLKLPRLNHFGIYPDKKHFVPRAAEVERIMKLRSVEPDEGTAV